LHEQKLIEYIKSHGLEFPLTGLSLRTGVDVTELKRVVKANGLEGYISGRFDVAVQDLMNSEKHTYTIIALADKHEIPYMALYKYLTSVGLKHLCFRPKRRLVGDIQAILELSTSKTVLEISKICKEKNLTPASRQGIMDLFEDYGILPITKKSRRLEKEQMEVK